MVIIEMDPFNWDEEDLYKTWIIFRRKFIITFSRQDFVDFVPDIAIKFLYYMGYRGKRLFNKLELDLYKDRMSTILSEFDKYFKQFYKLSGKM